MRARTRALCGRVHFSMGTTVSGGWKRGGKGRKHARAHKQKLYRQACWVHAAVYRIFSRVARCEIGGVYSLHWKVISFFRMFVYAFWIWFLNQRVDWRGFVFAMWLIFHDFFKSKVKWSVLYGLWVIYAMVYGHDWVSINFERVDLVTKVPISPLLQKIDISELAFSNTHLIVNSLPRRVVISNFAE